MNTPWPLFAFDNFFEGADRPYPTPERWDLQRELGYDMAYLSIKRECDESWQRLLDAPAQMERTGLGLAAAYTFVTLGGAEPARGRSPADMLEKIPEGSTFELGFTAGWKKDLSDPRRDPDVLAFLAPLISRAKERGVTISLYPHYGFWLERIEDAVRLAAAVDDPALRVTFAGYHWYAADRTDLHGKLRLAAPWLHRVNLCGAHPTPEGMDYPLPAVIEPVGGGDFPLAEFVEGLRAIRYEGPVGFQGYLVGGHPPTNLRQSLDAFRRAVRAVCP
jgi:sugar phosphate isomerase/epimerase